MIDELKERIDRYRAENPRAHARDMAIALGVSEAELVAARTGAGATALDARYQALFEALPALGSVKTMTRNATVVLERWGAFEEVQIGGPMGQVVGTDIDLRLFLRRWGSAFAVTEGSARGPRRSIQIFDVHGASVHKVYLEDESRIAAYDALVAAHAVDAPPAAPLPLPDSPGERPDAEIDVAALHAGWDAMRDTHEFFGLLRRFGVSRSQALRLGGEGRARAVATVGFEPLLRFVAQEGLPVMIFVGNRGAIQIHTGPIHDVRRMDGWLNVLDPRLNLHVREQDIASAWVVRKPTSDGIVTSVELYDARGDDVLLMFGKRKPGSAEDPRWRESVEFLAAAAPEDG